MRPATGWPGSQRRAAPCWVLAEKHGAFGMLLVLLSESRRGLHGIFTPPLGSLLRVSWRNVVCYLPCAGEWLAKGFAYQPGRCSSQGASLMWQRLVKYLRKPLVLGSPPRGCLTSTWQELGRARPCALQSQSCVRMLCGSPGRSVLVGSSMDPCCWLARVPREASLATLGSRGTPGC